MTALPIQQIFPALTASLPQQSQFIVTAAPGAGKSTELPLMLLQQSSLQGKIIMLEPRRLAAKSIATYLAQRLNQQPGETVGYQMRGESCVSAKTRLVIVTEGLLTRMIQADPMLSDVAMVIFDEYHERSLQADLGLALALEVQQGFNDELKIMLMSATLDTQGLQQLLPEASLFSSEGRSYPITYQYRPLNRGPQWLNDCARACAEIIQQQQNNVLVFLPGQREIRHLDQYLRSTLSHDISVHPLYGQLEFSAQQAAIAPPPKGKRKVVLATNIAETSLTIEGIDCVIDSGLERQSQFHARSGSSRLSSRMIARSSAIQRAGRAGRLAAGQCYRLYSEEQLLHRPMNNVPEIQRSDLLRLVMELHLWGASADQLTWLDQPPKGHLQQAEQLLKDLGLTNAQGQLTDAAQQVAQSALDPRLLCMLQQAEAWQQQGGENGLIYRACELAAFIEAGGQAGNALTIADALTQLKGLQKRNYQQILQRLSKRYRVSAVALNTEHWDGLLLAQAYPDRIAKQSAQGSFQLSQGASLNISEKGGHSYPSELVVIDQFWPEGRSQGLISLIAPLSLEALAELQPQRFSWQQHCRWSEKAQKLISSKHWCLGRLQLKTQAGDKIGEQQALQAWQARLAEDGLAWFPLSEAAEAWLIRARCALEWFKPDDWPAMDPQALAEDAEQWFNHQVASCRSLQQLKRLDWLAMLQSRLDWPQLQQLEQWVPSHYLAPSGNRCRIRYQQGQDPVISIQLQQMFGQPQSPMLGGRVKLMIELLSPAGRPLQLTQDLASFWQGAYSDVKKEMRGRYPKHRWPDDPANASPSSKTKRQLGE